MIECLRFGSRIPGANIGCCGVDIFQGFSSDPNSPASIQLVAGDIGTPCTKNSKEIYLGPTQLDIFKGHLKLGTFNATEMPNHAFLAILTDDQITNKYNDSGRKWLAILKDHGFEFIRAVRNSVYSEQRPPIYIFGLFRNVSGELDQFKPPKEWTDLPACSLNQREVWERDAVKLMTEEQLRELGVRVTLSGQKGTLPRTKLLGESPVAITEELDEFDEEFEDDEELFFEE